MTERWKDIFIIITLGVMAVLACVSVIDLFLVKTIKLDATVTIGFIGAVLGGVISGSFTLLGVIKTIRYEREKGDLEKLPGRIDNLETIISKVQLSTEISLASNTYFSDVYKILGSEKELIRLSISVDFKIYRISKLYLGVLSHLKVRNENKEKQLDGRVFVSTEKRRAAEELKKFLRVLESERKILEDKIYRII